MCVDIDIPDDRIPEEDETFTVIIMPDPRVNPGPDGDSTVTILDNGNCIYVASSLRILQMVHRSIDCCEFREFLDCVVHFADCTDPYTKHNSL